MRKINECLNENLTKICLLSYQLDKLQIVVHDFLPEHLKTQVSVGSFTKGQLLLCISNSVWATETNFLLPELRDYLRRELQLFQLIGIRLKIMPLEINGHKAKIKPNGISAQSRRDILATANQMEEGLLQRALQQLAQKR